MEVLYPPHREPKLKTSDKLKDTYKEKPSIFLAGSIDMGAAVDWQQQTIDSLKEYDVIFYNPRRPDWDSSWAQDPSHGSKFREQVIWELEHLEKANFVALYLADNSTSIISCLEFGLFIDKPGVIYCSPEFWRYGNIKIVAQRYDFKHVETNKDFINEIKNFVEIY